MLNSLNIALLCDSVSPLVGGALTAPDKTRSGSICYLGSDGLTAAEMPTLDTLNGRFTFDGTDFLVFPHVGNSEAVQEMGGPQEETYIILLDPFVHSSGVTTVLVMKDDSGGTGTFTRIRKTNGDEFDFRIDAGGGSFELVSTVGGVPAAWNGRQLMLTCVRAEDTQEIWAWDTLIVSDTDPTVDARNTEEVGLCASNIIGSNSVPAGTGLRFFGYGRFRATQTWLRQLSRFLRGNL